MTTPCPFRPGRTPQQQDTIRDTIRSCGVDATLAQVNARLSPMKLTATEGEFLRIYRTFHPSFGVPAIGGCEEEKPSIENHLRPKCCHCNRKLAVPRNRGLCDGCYRNKETRNLYPSRQGSNKQHPWQLKCLECTLRAQRKKHVLCYFCIAIPEVRKKHDEAARRKRQALEVAAENGVMPALRTGERDQPDDGAVPTVQEAAEHRHAG